MKELLHLPQLAQMELELGIPLLKVHKLKLTNLVKLVKRMDAPLVMILEMVKLTSLLIVELVYLLKMLLKTNVQEFKENSILTFKVKLMPAQLDILPMVFSVKN